MKSRMRDIEALWIKEAKRRKGGEIKSGKVKCKPAKDALREARLKTEMKAVLFHPEAEEEMIASAVFYEIQVKGPRS